MQTRSTTESVSEPLRPEKDQHPFEQVLERLSRRSLTEQEWINVAWEEYRLRDVRGVLLLPLIKTGCVTALFTLAMAWLLLHAGPPPLFPQWSDALGLTLLGAAMTTGISLFVLHGWFVGHRLGAADQRWLPDGYGPLLLQGALLRRLRGVREHLLARFAENRKGWDALRAQTDSPSLLHHIAEELLKALQHEENAVVPLTDPIRWLKSREDPHHLGTESKRRLAETAKNLTILVTCLDALERNAAFFNLSPELCAEETLPFRPTQTQSSAPPARSIGTSVSPQERSEACRLFTEVGVALLRASQNF